MASRSDVPGRNDPRRMREFMDRLTDLAREHGIASVVVGLAGQNGDPMIPELMDYMESALRMEDAVFRMTRERSVLFLTDVDRDQAEGIVGRLVETFGERFPTSKPPSLDLGFCEVDPAGRLPALRDALLDVFPTRA